MTTGRLLPVDAGINLLLLRARSLPGLPPAAAGARVSWRACRPSRARDWTPPSRRRVLALRDRLRLVYGRPSAPPHGRPLDELILTVLSQSTNDRNRDVAFLRLRARFPDWTAVREAPARGGRGGDPPRRALQGQVRAHPGDPARARRPALARPPRRHGRGGRARGAVPRCRASGARRRPACCCSASGCRDVPVDTHVSRVGTRLGPVPPGRAVRGAARRRCSRSRRAGRSSSSTSTCCATAAGRATRSARECPVCALRRMCPWARSAR